MSGEGLKDHRETPKCLTPERLSAVLLGESEMTTAEAEHIETCPACSAERVLMREFLEAEPTAEESAEVAWIVDSLRDRAARPLAPEPERKRGFFDGLAELFRARPAAAWSWVAAAACAVLAIGLSVRPGLGPEGGFEGGSGVVRSTRITVESPTPEPDAAPEAFAWAPVEGATRYEIEVYEVDGTPVWRGSTEQNRLATPGPVATAAVPGKTLLWRVRAFAPGGETVANSGEQRFQVALGASR